MNRFPFQTTGQFSVGDRVRVSVECPYAAAYNGVAGTIVGCWPRRNSPSIVKIKWDENGCGYEQATWAETYVMHANR